MDLSGFVGIDLIHHAQKGRGLVATKNFARGEVLIKEFPLVSCQFAWNQDLGYKACDHCMSPLETAEQNVRRLSQTPNLELPCNREFGSKVELFGVCQCQVVYCSSECQKAASDQYHRSLCSPPGSVKAKYLEKLRDVWKKIHYPPETATVFILLRIYAYIHQSEDKAAAISKFQNFASDASNPAVCEKLLGKFQDKINLLRKTVKDCVTQFQLDIPQALLTPEGFLTTLSILALNSQGIGTSALSAWVEVASKNGDDLVESFIDSLYARLEETVGLEFLDNEGSGLYELQSKVNHSCAPNMEIIFPDGNHMLGLRALRDVHQGEELSISYLDECQLSRSRHSRQKLLSEKHLFNCVCQKCEEDIAEPDETSADETDEDEDLMETSS